MYQVREHKFGADPVTTARHEYLDNAKASVHHAVRCYGVSIRAVSILSPNGEVWTLDANLNWQVTPKL